MAFECGLPVSNALVLHCKLLVWYSSLAGRAEAKRNATLTRLWLLHCRLVDEQISMVNELERK